MPVTMKIWLAFVVGEVSGVFQQYHPWAAMITGVIAYTVVLLAPTKEAS